MGFENRQRPRSLDELIVDVKFDLSDLRHLVRDGGSSEDVLAAIFFIEETMAQVAEKVKMLQWRIPE